MLARTHTQSPALHEVGVVAHVHPTLKIPVVGSGIAIAVLSHQPHGESKVMLRLEDWLRNKYKGSSKMEGSGAEVLAAKTGNLSYLWHASGGRRELIPASCPLTSYVLWCAHAHTNKCEKKKFTFKNSEKNIERCSSLKNLRARCSGQVLPWPPPVRPHLAM